jgi:GxxExxY protein
MKGLGSRRPSTVVASEGMVRNRRIQRARTQNQAVGFAGQSVPERRGSEPQMDSDRHGFFTAGRTSYNFRLMNEEQMDHSEPRMNGEEDGVLYKNETREIIGCAFEVLNTPGHGLLEKPYENALAVEFGLRGIPFSQQPRFDVRYKHVRVSEFVPDIIAYGSVIVDAKVIERIAENEIGQMLNLTVTGYKVGLILNFKRARLEYKRVIHPSAARIRHLNQNDRLKE